MTIGLEVWFGMRTFPSTLERIEGLSHVDEELLSHRGSIATSTSIGNSEGVSTSINSPGQMVVLTGAHQIWAVQECMVCVLEVLG